jgi:hypothetical protein
MTNEILINNRVNQITGSTDWLTFTDAGFPDLPETYTIADLDADRATDGGHYRNLYGIRLGKIPDPDTLRIFEYLADSNSDSFDSDSEAGAEYTRAASWPPAAGEFATSGNGDIVYFHASQVGVQVAVLPYEFRCTPLTIAQIRAFAEAAVSGSNLDALVDAAVDDAVAALSIGAYPPGHIDGLELSNNGTDDLDISAGSARDDSDTVNIDYAGGTIQTDVNFGTGSGALDTGSIGNGTYHAWAIYRSDTGVSSILISLSATAPTMPANYDYKRRIGVFRRVSAAIQLGTWTDSNRRFEFLVPVLDADTSFANTNAVLVTLSTPSGIKTKALFGFMMDGWTTESTVLITSPDQTDTTPGASAAFSARANSSYTVTIAANYEIRTNTSSQIRLRGTTGVSTYAISTYGWEDYTLGA